VEGVAAFLAAAAAVYSLTKPTSSLVALQELMKSLYGLL
jgi:hypothetical protein